MTSPTPRWHDVTTTAPELAAAVQARFEAHGLGLLATLRGDGFPRISGIEPLFADGELWLGMMPDSRKAHDLQRDPRLALHSATVDTQVTEGDARITGTAHEHTDEADKAAFLATFAQHTGQDAPEGPLHLFRVAPTEAMLLRPAGDHLDIRWWTATDGEHQVDRY